MYTYYLYEYVKDTELCSTALNIRNLILLLNQLLFFFHSEVSLRTQIQC